MKLRHEQIIKGLFLAVGFYALVTRLWACEDAYITFRYVQNWINGDGLVYNVGDRVEGFTHPLWLFLISIPTFLGLHVRASALLLSLVISLVAMCLILFKDRGEDDSVVTIPLAALLLFTHSGFRDFSVSGLEFPLVVLLMAWFFISYKRNDLLTKPYLHGSLLAALYLTRPELVLMIPVFYAVYGAKALVSTLKKRSDESRSLWQGLMRLTIPIALIAGSYHLFRWAYYGEFFPNTYYAKQGLGAYWSQGWVYFDHFWRYSPVFLGVVILSGALILFTARLRRLYFTSLPRVVMLLQAVILTIYVVRLGGDFMGYRFLLPPMLIVVILLNDLPDRLFSSRNTKLIGAGTALALTIILVLVPLKPPQRAVHIADERQYYDLYHPPYRALFEDPVEHVWWKMGTELKGLSDAIDYRIVYSAGNIGYLGFAAGPGVYILDAYGLVDRQTARAWHVPIKRGRPGHEHKLTMDMAIDRGATFLTTPFPEWEKAMSSGFGSVITLDPKFLRHVPDKVEALKKLKEAGRQGQITDGSYEFLLELEKRYSVDVDKL